MKKDTLIRVVVMVVALLAASYLANILDSHAERNFD